MGLFSKLFASPNDVSDTLKDARSGIDKMFYTKEEKAEDDIKFGDWYIRYLDATKPQNLARRFIALIVTGIWSISVIAVLIGLAWQASFVDGITSFFMTAVTPPFMLVMYFYFRGHRWSKEDSE